MTTPTFPRPFAVTDVDTCAVENYGARVLLTPVPDTSYLLAFAQYAGWFYYPMYFLDEGEDGMQHISCWSLSLYDGGVMNFVWLLEWDSHFEPVLALCQQFQHCGSSFGAGSYLFSTQALDKRAMWRAAESSNTFGPAHIVVALHSRPQLDWFGLGNLALNINQPMQHQLDTSPDPTYRITSHSPWGAPNIHINPADMSFRSVPALPTPPTTTVSYLDAFSNIPTAHNSRTSSVEPVMRGPMQFFSTNSTGELTLIVPRTLETREAVHYFLINALSSGELGEKMRKVKCSLCKNKKADKLWDIKPSNLNRHIMAHLGIKYHPCVYCEAMFTTKDQMNKHIKNKHLVEARKYTPTVEVVKRQTKT